MKVDNINATVENFINEDNTKLKTLKKWVVLRIDSIGKNIDDVITLPKEELYNVIIEMQPVNMKMISNFVYILNLYAKFIDNQNALEVLDTIDRNEIWNEITESGKKQKRFISKENLDDLVFDIETFEEFNNNYYSCLLRSIYYGIYCDDMSVIFNLRGRDIDVNGKAHLRKSNGEEYDINIPCSLAEDLIELSNVTDWERYNRYGSFKIKIEGEANDSCFKFESRGSSTYHHVYFAKLRKIFNEYASNNIKPKNIYISGIMNNIIDRLDKDGITLTDAFNEQKRACTPMVQEELNKAHYKCDIGAFRQMVCGHLEDFVSDERRNV